MALIFRCVRMVRYLRAISPRRRLVIGGLDFVSAPRAALPPNLRLASPPEPIMPTTGVAALIVCSFRSCHLAMRSQCVT